MKFNRLGSAISQDILFDTYISEDEQLMIQKCPYNAILEDNWTLLPNINKSEIIDKFYALYSERIKGTFEYCKEQAQLFYKDNTNIDWPIHLICDHCNKKVERGINNIVEHSFICPVYTECNIGNGLIARKRPAPSYTSIYKKL